MTNRTLSEQICEVCGIEPRKDYIPTNCATVQQINVYPDFENNNNNFMKLVNIIYTCGINQKYDYQLATLSFEEDYCYYSEKTQNTFQERYLDVLLHLLDKNYDNWDKKFQKILKQAIKQADWEV